MKIFKHIYRSFPVQLFVMHIKHHQVLLLSWLLLFFTVSGYFGRHYGIPYLFLDPEYLGEVNFLSFALIGAGFGGFVMTWNITTYILNSHRFPFLASLNWPFAAYCLNNAIIPTGFMITYFILLYRFQSLSEFQKTNEIILNMAGFVMGLLIPILVSSLYFQLTNKNIEMFGIEIKPKRKIRRAITMKKNLEWQDYIPSSSNINVEYYISIFLTIRPVRKVLHYDRELLNRVFNQHHSNALIAELATLSILIALGFLIDYKIFRIPAGTSIFLLISMLTALSGIFAFWLGFWKNLMFIVLLIAIDYISKYDFFVYKNAAYGLNYSSVPAQYHYDELQNICTPQNIDSDIRTTINALNHRREATGEKKPMAVIINISGGGLSSAMFSTRMLQIVDSQLNGRLFDNTFLITGASGGSFGGAFIRELYLRKRKGIINDFYSLKYPIQISNDILNAVSFTIIVNDIFYPFQTFNIGNYQYRKDRGYIFEKTFDENTDYILNKSLSDYKQPELNGEIPLMIFVPTILNDQRKLFIGSLPMSYMMKPLNTQGKEPQYNIIDGIDFIRFFQAQDAENLKVTSAMRMSGTYPYILPSVNLPSKPTMEVIDAGMRDNYGIETTVRFLDVFYDWFQKNTRGVVIIEITGSRNMKIEDYEHKTILSRFFNPISNLFYNWMDIQTYYQNYMLHVADECFMENINWIHFQYIPSKKDESAALSLHLTSKEKKDILNAATNPANMKEAEKLKHLLLD